MTSKNSTNNLLRSTTVGLWLAAVLWPFLAVLILNATYFQFGAPSMEVRDFTAIVLSVVPGFLIFSRIPIRPRWPHILGLVAVYALFSLPWFWFALMMTCQFLGLCL